MGRISPIILLVIVILAIGFFLLGLLQLLIRFVMKRPSFSSISTSNRHPDSAAASASHTFQRQLQQLFRLHDSGLDQSLIDALPVFSYKDIIGLKEPFDCAVCLSEFSFLDKLKFLPNCTHAFHIHCIETWLLSNSTCPLCRSSIGLGKETPTLNYDFMDQWSLPCPNQPNGPSLHDSATPGRVFSIRLGKFRSPNGGVENEATTTTTTSSSIDARRCYSMGAFQYVVADSNLQVSLPRAPTREGDGKKIGYRSRGDSFSVSKIWLWSKKSSTSEVNQNLALSMPKRSELV